MDLGSVFDNANFQEVFWTSFREMLGSMLGFNWQYDFGWLLPFLILFVAFQFGGQLLDTARGALSMLFPPPRNTIVRIGNEQFLVSSGEAQGFLDWSGMTEMPSGKRVTTNYAALGEDGKIMATASVDKFVDDSSGNNQSASAEVSPDLEDDDDDA
jgi:hypothetical protein